MIECTIENYQKIILTETLIIDVRSESEYDKAHLPNSINIPILNDSDREKVGICYKEQGSEIAIDLGYQLVSGEKKQVFLDKIEQVISQNENCIVMCFRGGNRSKITSIWIKEVLNKDIKRLENGYKGFRNYLISALEPENIKLKPVIIAGNTGCGKTKLINRLSMAIDLEKLAKHRGSAFGAYIEEQPKQATFENKLAYEMIKMADKNPSFVAFESESKNIGKSVIPNAFFEYMHSAPYVMLDMSIEERTNITYDDYVVSDLAKHQKIYGELQARKIWSTNLREKITRLKRKLGEKNMNYCLALFDQAEQENIELHKKWIEFLLVNYYDPMYEHHRSRWCDKVVVTKGLEEMYQFLETKNNKHEYII